MVGKIKHINFRKAKLQYLLFFGITILFVGIYAVGFSGLFSRQSARAAGTITSAGSGDWSATATWSGGVVPVAGDDVIIGASHTVTFTSSIALINNLTIGGTLVQNNSTTSSIGGSLLIQSGGKLTHTANSTTALGQQYIVKFAIAGDATINADGSIDADGKGYSVTAACYSTAWTGCNGPGAGWREGVWGSGSGGSHGGTGGFTAYGYYAGQIVNSWAGYCDISNVATMGSAGGSDGAGAGGGLIILGVTGKLTINGKITADGSVATVDSRGGGAGGGIKITAGMIDWNMVTPATNHVSVAGGNYGGGNLGGGGGGGCIQIIYTDYFSHDVVAGDILLSGGTGSAYSYYVGISPWGQKGGAGLALIKKGAAAANLYLTNNVSGGALSIINGNVVADTATLNNADMSILASQTLSLSNATPFITSGTSTLSVYGTLTAVPLSNINNITLTFNSGGVVTNGLSNELTIGSTGSLIINSGATVPVTGGGLTSVNSSGILNINSTVPIASTAIFNINSGTTTLSGYTTTSSLSLASLTVASGAVLTHAANTTFPSSIINIISSGNITINGSINVSGKGYSGGAADSNGNGPFNSFGLYHSYYDGGGGAHCGVGGSSRTGQTVYLTGGATSTLYCNTANINTMGAGGGGSGRAGSAGGGLIILNVGNTLNVAGATLTAKGLDGLDDVAHGQGGSGGGAGGGINIIANNIVGVPALFTVAGGNCAGTYSNAGGGGGGGGINISYRQSNSILTAVISGGTNGYETAGVGSFPTPVQINSAPTLTPTIYPTQISTNIVTVTTTITDADSNITNLILEYSLDNSTWVSSTLSNVTASSGTVVTSTGSITNIDTDTGPINLTIEWDISTAPLLNTEDSTVYFRIIPNDGVINGATITSASFGIDNKVPTAPGNLTLSTLTNTTALLTFGSLTVDTNFKEYKIFYKPTSPGVTTSDSAHTSSTDSNLALINFNNSPTTLLPNLATSTKYYANIWAYDTYGNYTPALEEQSFYTLSAVPGTPIVTVSTTLDTSLHIIVDNSTNANNSYTTYSICQTIDDSTCIGNSYLEQESNTLIATPDWHTYTAWGESTGLDILNLTPNSCYRFLVQARNGDNITTALSTPNNSTCTLAPPFTNLVVTNVSNTTTLQLSLTHTASTQTGMKIDRDSNCNGSFDTVIFDSINTLDTSPTTTSYNVSANTCYQYRIQSYNSQGVLNESQYILSNQLTTPPNQVTGLSANITTETSIHYIWNAVAEATSYLLYDNLTGNLIDTISGATEYLYSNLTANTSHQVVIRPNNSNAQGVASSPVTAITLASLIQNIQAPDSDKTVSSIKWTWNNSGQTQSKAQDKTTTANTSDWTNDLFWNETSLSANTQYTVQVQAKNSNDEPTAFNEFSAYTLQNIPTSISFSGVTTENITVTANGSFPNQGVSNSIINFNNGAGDNQAVSAGTAWSNAGLTPNTSYTYTVYTKNGDGDSSASINSSKYTLANTPGQITSNIPAGWDSDQLVLTLSANSNPNNTNFLLYNTTLDKYIDKTTKSSTIVREANYDTLTNWTNTVTLTGLTPNTEYQFQAIAKNGEDVESTASVASISKFTRAATPANLSAVVSSPTEITVSWTANGNPTGTEYYVVDANDPVNRKSDWNSTLTRTFTGLQSATAYSFQVKARNVDSIATDYSTAVQATTQSSGGSAASLPPPPTVPPPVVVEQIVVNDQPFAVTIETTPDVVANLETIHTQLLSADPITQTSISASFSINSGILMNFGSGSDQIIVTGIGSDTADLTIFSTPQKVTLKLNEEVVKDVNNDGKPEMYLKLTKVDSKTKEVIITVTDLNDLPFTINNNLAYTTSTQVALTIKTIPGVTQMAISEDKNFSNTSFETYTKYKTFTLSPGEGLKTIYVRFRNAQGGSTDTKSTITYTKDITAYKNQKETTITNTVTTVNTVKTEIVKAFNTYLTLGSKGTEVTRLQIFLKDLNYFIYPQITNFFGNVTKNALKLFQKDNNLNTTGSLDTNTRKTINNIILPPTNTTNTTSTTPTTTKITLTKNICTGSIGQEVRNLQTILMDLGYLKIPKTTGTYASKTKSAVRQYQVDHNISPTNGCAGPVTRGEMNGTLQK